MELLDPSKIRKDKEIDSSQAKERINKLGTEESRLVLSISDLKIEEEKKKNYILLINKNYKEIEEKIKLDTEKLNNEVLKLEGRKKEAKKPVDLKEEEIKNKFIEIEKEKEGVVKSKEELDTDRKEIENEKQISSEDKKKIEEKKKEIGVREEKIVESEQRIEQNETNIDEDKKEFSKFVEKENNKLKDKEEQIRVAGVANENVRIANTTKTADLNERDRMITDKYNALIEATKEFENKKNGKRS